MSDFFTIAAAGFGLAGHLVIPAKGPIAALRDRFIEPGWRVLRWKARRQLRLPAVGPHQCLPCATPYAATLVWALQAVLGGSARELLLVVLVASGITFAAMVLAGFASPSPAKAGKAGRCSSCSRKGAGGAAKAACDGASTTAR